MPQRHYNRASVELEPEEEYSYVMAPHHSRIPSPVVLTDTDIYTLAEDLDVGSPPQDNDVYDTAELVVDTAEEYENITLASNMWYVQ